MKTILQFGSMLNLICINVGETYPSCPDNVLSASPEMVKGSSDLGDLEAFK